MLSQNAVKLLKTQDLAYLQSSLQRTAKAIDKLEHEFTVGAANNVQVLGQEDESRGNSQHLVFVDDEKDQARIASQTSSAMPPRRGLDNLPASEADNYENSSLKLKQVRESRRQLAREAVIARETAMIQRKHRKEQNARRVKLAALKNRRKDLRSAEEELERQRAKMSNSIGGVTKSGKKWRIRERKR